MNGVDGRGYMPPPNSMANNPGIPGGMPPMGAPPQQHMKAMHPPGHPGNINNPGLPHQGLYAPTSLQNQMQGMHLSQRPPGNLNSYNNQMPGYAGQPPATSGVLGQPPVSGYNMNSQPNHMMPPASGGAPPHPGHILPNRAPSSMANVSSAGVRPPLSNSNFVGAQNAMHPPHSSSQLLHNQPGHIAGPPQSYSSQSGPPMPAHSGIAAPAPMPGRSSLPGQHSMQPPMHGQPQMTRQPPMPGQPPMAGQPQRPGQPPIHGIPPMTSQPPMPGQHHPYPSSNQQFPNQPSPQRRLDPDAMPSPLQVIESDRMKWNEPFRTDCPGATPPLVTTDVVIEDCGSASPSYIRCATYSLPATSDIANACQFPMALSVKPLANPHNEAPLAIVDPGSEGPIRCKRCKAYMCPQFKFTDGGRRFQCCMCCAITDTPPQYFNHLDQMNQRVDKYHRPELCRGSYEFLVTKDYCKNDQLPNPPAYIFAIDVSYNAVKSGLVSLLCDSLKHLLDSLPTEYGADETAIKVGFFTYDRTLHFYNLKSTLAQPQMLVVSDVSEIFVPLQDGFLVSLNESRNVINSLLTEIPEMFADTRESETVLGPVVSSAIQAMKSANCCGKLFLFSTTMPTIDAPGKLKNRDDRKVIGTDKEKGLFSPAGNFYTSLAKDCVSQGCCVDLFLFPNQYMDIATIGQLAQLTGGDLYKYQYFKPEVDGQSFISDLQHNIEKETVFDAILRVRTSTGIRAVNFVGALHMTNTTDVELAGLDCDKAISVEIKHDDKISEDLGAFVQVALLYTSISGQRRLRLHNMHLSVCTQITDLYRSCEADVLMNFFAKSAIKYGLQQGLSKTKDELVSRVANILATYRKHCATPSSSGQLILPECLKLLPVYLNSLLKNDGIHSSHEIATDDRAFLRQVILSMDVTQTQLCFYPLLLPVKTNEPIDSVKPVRCSEDRLKSSDAYLLYNGINSFLWIGSDVDPGWIKQVFGVPSVAQIDIDSASLCEFENPVSSRVCNLLKSITGNNSRCSKLTLVRQRDKLEPWFKRFLVEDRVAGTGASYVDFLCHIHKEIRAILA